MHGSIVEAFQATARLQRTAIFSSDVLTPISSPSEAVVAAPGWVGPAWRSGGTLLVGINPGGGGDAYRANPTDAALYGLIRSFRDAPARGAEAALAALSAEWIAIQASHNIRRVIEAVFEAINSSAARSAFINVVPFRMRNDAAPRRADLLRAWEVASRPQVAALSPGRIIALGRKAYNALVGVGADRTCELVLIKRSIGDSTVTPEAREALARLACAQLPVATPPPSRAALRAGAPQRGLLPKQSPATPATRYEAARQPTEKDGYAQRIPIWQAVKRLGSVNRAELLGELRRSNYARPNGAAVDEAYCRIELTDMTKRGYLRRVQE